jgi:CheY-like chemotaxis protein
MKTKKILVVEDDKVTQTLISGVLKSAGYEVITADDATTAVKIARQEEPDLITLDINLPASAPGDTWDGFTVAGWIRRLKSNSETPVIVVISGVEPGQIVEKAAAVGAYTFLPKPFDKATLLKTIDSALK